MLKKISENYRSARLISETVEHTGSYLEARLEKEGVFIEKTRTGGLRENPFHLSGSELSDAVELIERWGELAIALPAFVSAGSPVGGIHAISYYPANSPEEKFSVVGHDRTVQYLQTESYKRLSAKIHAAECGLNAKHAASLSRKGIRACIYRFNVTLERLDGENVAARCILNEAEMQGIRELAPLYRQRRRRYA